MIVITQTRDRGEATTQLVVLTPLLILLVFLGMQTAIYFHAANVAAAAASEGAAAGAPVGADADDAARAAARTIEDLQGHVVGVPLVSSGGGFVEVTVVIEVPRIVPFFPSSVRRTAIEPLERFVSESNR